MPILNEQQLLCKESKAAFAQVIELVVQAHTGSSRIDELERQLMPALMKAGLACLQDFVAAAGDGDQGEQLTVNDQVVKRSPEKQSRVYRSIFGQLSIDRYTYHLRAKTKALAQPLDQQLGLPADEVSYVLEDWLGNLSVEIPYQSAVNWLEKTLGIQASPTTAHRRIDKLGSYAEDFNEQRKSVPLAGEKGVLVAQADGKGVPIRTPFEQRANEELGIPIPHRPALKNDYPKSKHRSTVGSKAAKTQRVTCGAFYSIAPQPRTVEELLQEKAERKDDPNSEGKAKTNPRPANKRLWAELNLIGEQEVSRGAVRVFESLAEELSQRDPKRLKPLICLMDGDPHLWTLQEEYLPGAIRILDLFHATEYLWKAGNCFYRDNSEEADQWVSRQLKKLLENKVDHVRGLLKRTLNEKKMGKTQRKTLKKVYDYFTKNRQQMRYGEYLAAGYPVGSGVIEGACKHVVGDRMCGTGMRWEDEGAQPMLDMRVAKLNQHWEQFIEFRIKTQQTQIYSTAA